MIPNGTTTTQTPFGKSTGGRCFFRLIYLQTAFLLLPLPRRTVILPIQNGLILCYTVVQSRVTDFNRMINIKFYLHSFTNKAGQRPLYCRVHTDGLYELRAAVHEYLKPKDWNHDKQTVKASEKYNIEINQRLDRIRGKVAAQLREMLDQGQVITNTHLQEIIRPSPNAPAIVKEPTVREVYDDWKAQYLTAKNEGNKGKEKGTNYVRRFLQVISKLEEFKPGATLKDIDAEFMKRYRSYLISKDLQDTTIENHFKTIRALLIYKSYPANIKAPAAAKPTKHALYWDEVVKLATADYKVRRVKEIALIFVANCQLCLRYGDLYQINTNLIQVRSLKHGTVKAVNLNQGKTGDPIFIPAPPRAAAILEKFGGVLPLPKLDKNSSSFQFNRWLKQAAREAGLNRLVRITKVINEHITESWVPLSEQISAHSARHTGFSLVRQATGNKDLAEAQLGHSNAGVYDHTDPVTVVDSLLEAWEIIDG